MDTEQRERPKANARSESGAEATVNTHEAEVFEENQAGEGCEEQRGSGGCHNLNVTEAIAPKSKSPGDPVNRHPGHLNRGETTGRSSRPKATPNSSTSGSHHSNQEETSQHCDSKAPKLRPGEPGKEKHTISQFHASLRVKTVTTGGTENGLKKGGGTTEKTVPKARHRY